MHHQGFLTLAKAGEKFQSFGTVSGPQPSIGHSLPKDANPREELIPVPGSPEPQGWHPVVPGEG